MSWKKVLKSKMTVTFALLLLLALVIELGAFVFNSELSPGDTQVSLTDTGDYSCVAYNCVFDGSKYVVTAADPQIVFTGFSQDTKYVVIDLKSAPLKPIEWQIFYAEEGQGFSENNSASGVLENNRIECRISPSRLTSLRIDIDGDVEIESIRLFDATASYKLTLARRFSFARFFILFAGILLILYFVVTLYFNRKKNRGITVYEAVFMLICFVYYLSWNFAQGINYAPDEAMRMDVTLFMLEHNRLPVGDELIHPIWGFSYAHMPTVLCNALGFFCVKLALPFTTNTLHLYYAARMVSVLAGVGTVYFLIKSSKLLFSSNTRWIFIVLVSFIPQFAFLSSYVNNDSLAVFGSSAIFYAWAYVIKNKWDYKIASVLVFGMSVCALSYYNSYAWILVSIPFCIITYLKQNPKDYKGMFKLGGFVTAATLIIICYPFIRHQILYGDFLGLSTGAEFGEIFAQPGMKPSERLSLKERGVGLWDMLFGKTYKWVSKTFESFFGLFGYMEFRSPSVVYEFYKLFFVAGAASLLCALILNLLKKEKISRSTVLLFVCLALVTVITVALSVYRSYTDDFQPQGRYCYPAVIPICFAVARGFDEALMRIKKQSYRDVALGAVCAALSVVSVFVFNVVVIPTC